MVRVMVAAVAILGATVPAIGQVKAPVAPGLTPEQIRASEAAAPTFNRSAAREKWRLDTYRGRPLGAMVQKAFDGFSNYLYVSAQMMPESGYPFRPTPDVRNFGEQINHATGAHYSFCNQAGVPPGFTRRTAPDLRGVTKKPEIIKALEDSITYCSSLMAAATEAWLMETAPGLGGAGSGQIEGIRAYALVYNAIHSAEDYGTITTYLRLQGIVPPSTALNPPAPPPGVQR